MKAFGTDKNLQSACPCCRPCVMLSRDGKRRRSENDKQVRRIQRKRGRRIAVHEIMEQIFDRLG